MFQVCLNISKKPFKRNEKKNADLEQSSTFSSHHKKKYVADDVEDDKENHHANNPENHHNENRVRHIVSNYIYIYTLKSEKNEIEGMKKKVLAATSGKVK